MVCTDVAAKSMNQAIDLARVEWIRSREMLDNFFINPAEDEAAEIVRNVY